MRGVNTCPTGRPGSSAPAYPAEISCSGRYSSITASVARRAHSAPIPPQTTTVWSRSKNVNWRPSDCCRRTRQCLTRGRTSRSSAATIAILAPARSLMRSWRGNRDPRKPAPGAEISSPHPGTRSEPDRNPNKTKTKTKTGSWSLDILVFLKPLHRAPQGALDRNRLPSQFPLRLGRGNEHLLAPHAHGVNGGARLPPQDVTRNQLIDHPGRQGKGVRNSQLGRGQPGNRPSWSRICLSVRFSPPRM